MATMLKDVSARTRNGTVKVRVIHSWWHNATGKDLMLELIFGDEQESCISSSLRGKKNISQWQNLLTHGAVVSIKAFSAASNGTQMNHKF